MYTFKKLFNDKPYEGAKKAKEPKDGSLDFLKYNDITMVQHIHPS